MKKYTKFLPFVEQLELKEVRYIYGKFFDTTTGRWQDDDFIRELISDGCYENKLSLDEIGERVGQKPNI